MRILMPQSEQAAQILVWNIGDRDLIGFRRRQIQIMLAGFHGFQAWRR